MFHIINENKCIKRINKYIFCSFLKLLQFFNIISAQLNFVNK